MSLFDTIALIVLGVSLAGIGLIVGRKFPTLASIDTAAAVSPTAERKSTLIEQRLRRKFQTAWDYLRTAMMPATKRFGPWWETAHDKLRQLEHEYKIRSLPVLLNRFQRKKVDEEIAEILAQATALFADGEYGAAEEKSLHVVRLEPRSVPAFELLGDLYLRTKEYAHAKEVYLFLLKLIDEPDAIFHHGSREPGASDEIDRDQHRLVYRLDVAQIYRSLEDWPRAFETIQAAARQAPNNPKVLDEYIEIGIGCGKRQFAAAALRTIRETTPHNSKIADWEARIEAMPVKPVRDLEAEAAAETIDMSGPE